MDIRSRWSTASSIWVIAGFLYPLLTPATTLLSAGLERYLSSAAGMDSELANRVAFTIFRIPLTVVLGVLVAAAQCAVLPEVRPLARRWIIAAAVGACISTLIILPSSLVALRTMGTLEGTVRTLLLLWGAGLLGGLVSLLQRRAFRGKGFAPGWFLAASVLAAAVGVFAGDGLLHPFLMVSS